MRPNSHDPEYNNRFREWLATASGSELMHYKPKNASEKELIEAEINRRLDANIPKLAQKFVEFLNIITEVK